MPRFIGDLSSENSTEASRRSEQRMYHGKFARVVKSEYAIGSTLPDSGFYKLLHEFLNGRSRRPASDVTARIAGDLPEEGMDEQVARRRKTRRRVIGGRDGRLDQAGLMPLAPGEMIKV